MLGLRELGIDDPIAERKRIVTLRRDRPLRH